MPSLAKPAKGTAQRDKTRRRNLRISRDVVESNKVKARSGGRCEMVEPWPYLRCWRRAVHIHHRLGGIGVRGRGASAKAENKLHLCNQCHSDIHAHVLVPDGSHFTDQFQRVR